MVSVVQSLGNKMLKAKQNKNKKISAFQALIIPATGFFALIQPANAQTAPGTISWRDPLVPGASFSLPFVTPAPGLPPAFGSGPIPLPVNPGMGGSPTSIPWANGTAGNPFSQPTNQVVVPATQIDLQNTQISLPINNSAALPPGTLNSQVGGSIPHAPSTPGADPGMLRPPSFNDGSSGSSAAENYESPAALTSVGEDGTYPVGLAPTTRVGTYQKTQDFGLVQAAGKSDSGRQFYGYRLQMAGANAQPSWQGQAGSYTTDFGQSMQQLKAAGQLGNPNYQVSYDSPSPATYPGQSGNGTTGNHENYFPNAQVTNDLYGAPMINTAKIGYQAPLTTVAPY
jgi:hypothetical protein